MEGDKLKQKNVRITLFQGVLDLWPKPLSLISRKDFMLLAKYLAVFESLGCRCIPIFILLKGRERSRQRERSPICGVTCQKLPAEGEGQDKAGAWDSLSTASPPLPCYVGHCLLSSRVHFRRKLDVGQESGREPKYWYECGQPHSNLGFLNHLVKELPLKL